ncbi:hypothetical protein CTAYLR_002378 [Chrysophaeum taylorii]|uniref:Histone H1 n=1 Tax=Chrysophaeum taylorii TaxID=2483200 RepID=A0AAD7UIS1_9STRA|nr:hypothetical protein CTAYLR_002378 [Chrysophaeum taylorii]
MNSYSDQWGWAALGAATATPSSVTSSTSVEDFVVGDLVICENDGVWYEAKVIETSQRSRKRKMTTIYRVSYDGWGAKWDEWVDLERLRTRTPDNAELAKASREAAEREAEEERRAKKESQARKAASSSPSSSSSKKKSEERRSSHPSYADMAMRAVEQLKDRSGSSAVAISKWIKARYPVHATKYKQSVSAALKSAVAAGKLVKVKASFKLSAKEARARQGKPKKKAEPEAVDDLEVAARAREKGDKVPARPFPDFALVLSPPIAAKSVLGVAEFCRVLFHEPLLGRGRESVSVLDLDAALSVLPTDQTPPLLERLALALLRLVCGRDLEDGAPTDAAEDACAGHAQNRRIWGHALNAVTWPDILRRHLGAERRFRQRVRDAYPPSDNHKPLSQTYGKSAARLVPSPSPKKKKRCARYFPFEDSPPARGDDDVLADALDAYCDAKTSFSRLRPEHAAALLHTLVDDALATPAVQRVLRESEAVLEARAKQHRAAAMARRKIERAILQKNGGGQQQQQQQQQTGDADADAALGNKSGKELEEMLETATQELEAATAALDAATTRTHCLRRDPLGSDRYFSHYWRLASLDETVCARDGAKNRLRRLAVCLHPCDERYDAVYSPWCCFDLVSDPALIETLDDRGEREATLSAALREDDALARAKKEKGGASSYEARLVVATAARDRLAVVVARPPPPNSSAATLPWPGAPPPPKPPDDEEGDKPEPRRSSRRKPDDDDDDAAANKGKKARGTPNDDDTSRAAIEKRAEIAAELAAPWRWQHDSIRKGLEAVRVDLDAILARLDAIAHGEGEGEGEGTPPADRPAVTLGLLCADALRAEACLASFLKTGDEYDADDEEDDEYYKATTSNGGAVDDLDWIERDAVSEDDYYELCGACSEIKEWRNLWRAAVDSCAREDPDAEATTSRFASLFGVLAQAVERRAPALEARAKAAAKLLLPTDETTRRKRHQPVAVAGAVFLPSEPTTSFFWARIRGYPWWPARAYRPTNAAFVEALEARNVTLIVFVGESIQYLLDTSALAP